MEAERRNEETSQSATMRIIYDQHHYKYTIQSTMVADRVVANASDLIKVLNVLKHKSDPLTPTAHTSRVFSRSLT